MVMPMSSALFLHEMFRHSEMVVASTPTSAFNLIVTDQTGDGVGFTAAGLVIKLMRAHFAGALPVQLDGNPSQPMVSGTAWVDVDIGTKPTGSPHVSIGRCRSFLGRPEEVHSFGGQSHDTSTRVRASDQRGEIAWNGQVVATGSAQRGCGQ
jgi:hypothetical protein